MLCVCHLFSGKDIAGPSKIPGLGKEVGKAAKSFQQAAKVGEHSHCLYGLIARSCKVNVKEFAGT